MHPNRIAQAALCLGLLSLVTAPPARAQRWERDASTLHVVEPLRVPGAVLAPGSYRIRVVDEQSNRNVVEITDLDGTTVYATMIATPHVEARSRPGSEFVFDRDAEGRPIALRSWWAPNDPYGQDFFYGRAEAAEIARLAEPEPAVVPAVSRTTGPGAPAHGVESTTAPAAKRSAPPEAVAAKRAPAKMPHTASVVPLLALAGLAALGGAAALRATDRRAA